MFGDRALGALPTDLDDKRAEVEPVTISENRAV